MLAFAGVGDALLANGTRRVVAIDERQVVRRDADGEALALGAARALELLGRQRERLRELVGGGDGVPQLPAPVVTGAREGVAALRRAERGERESRRLFHGAPPSPRGATFTCASAASSISTGYCFRRSSTSASSAARTFSWARLHADAPLRVLQRAVVAFGLAPELHDVELAARGYDPRQHVTHVADLEDRRAYLLGHASVRAAGIAGRADEAQVPGEVERALRLGPGRVAALDRPGADELSPLDRRRLRGLLEDARRRRRRRQDDRRDAPALGVVEVGAVGVEVRLDLRGRNVVRRRALPRAPS